MSTSLCISTEPIIFTRYLYNKVEVKQRKTGQVNSVPITDIVKFVTQTLQHID